MSDDDVIEQLDDTPFVGVAQTHEELKNADDDELIRLFYAYAREETANSDFSSLTSWAYVTFALRERGYVVDENNDGEGEIRMGNGDLIEPDIQGNRNEY